MADADLLLRAERAETALRELRNIAVRMRRLQRRHYRHDCWKELTELERDVPPASERKPLGTHCTSILVTCKRHDR